MPKLSVEDLYDEDIHGVTFTLVPRLMGAKVYKQHGVEIRMVVNRNMEAKKFHLTLEQMKQLAHNVNLVYRVAKLQDKVKKKPPTKNVWKGIL